MSQKNYMAKEGENAILGQIIGRWNVDKKTSAFCGTL
jgi:hypothetical protein